jgi:hypothetical protein
VFADFGHWLTIRDGDPRARYLYQRHYSCHHYRDGRKPCKILGPGEYMLLLTVTCDALFGWQYSTIPRSNGEEGVNCTVFRNEGSVRSSDLIREACALAWQRWTGARLFTYVNPKAVRSSNPGYCFLRAGWRKCGVTKWNKLLILEMKPEWRLDDTATGQGEAAG